MEQSQCSGTWDMEALGVEKKPAERECDENL